MMNPAPSTGPAALDIGQLYQRHGAMVLRRVQRFYRDPVEAQDVLQEVFLRAMEKLHTFQGLASPSTWLYQLATRYCLNRLRNAGRRQELLEEQAEGCWWGATASGPQQERDALLRSLWRVIDAELLEIGIYYHLDGMTHDEIARVVGCSRRTVGNRLAELEARARAAGEAR